MSANGRRPCGAKSGKSDSRGTTKDEFHGGDRHWRELAGALPQPVGPFSRAVMRRGSYGILAKSSTSGSLWTLGLLPIVGSPLPQRIGPSVSRKGRWRERPCKPDPVPCPRAGGRPFLWDRARARPRTTYPEGAIAQVDAILPYLVFLRVGFAVPDLSPDPRCALTAPFHPCPLGAIRRWTRASAVFSLWHFPWPRDRLPLTTTLTCGVRTFLPARSHAGRTRSGRPGLSRREHCTRRLRPAHPRSLAASNRSL